MTSHFRIGRILLGFFLDSSWILLDSSWILPRFFLDYYWILPGFFLDSSWILLGFFLDFLRDYFVIILGYKNCSKLSIVLLSL
jgi:hypothetical protein